MPLLRIGNYIVYCGIYLCLSTTAFAFTPKTIEAPILGFTGYGFSPKNINVPILGFTGYAFASKTIEVPVLGFTGYGFSPKNINVPIMGFSGYATASAGSYGHIGPQAPINTGLEGGSSINKGRLESLGMAKPDLAVLPQLSIGGSATRWGGTVMLTGQQVQPAGNGLCSASITYTVQNSGTALAPAFTSALFSNANPGQPASSQWAPLAHGANQSKTEQVLLRPGKNSLTMYLDHTGQIDELNKANNQVRLLVILNGVCQPQYQQYQPQLPAQQQPPKQHLPVR